MFAFRKANSPAPTVIGKGTMIEGTLRVYGPVQIDGEIEGALIAEGHVSIGPTGSVVGELVAVELELGGRVDGSVNVRDHLHVAAGATARGELRYGTIEVERGGMIEGSTLQSEADETLEPEAAVLESPALPSATGRVRVTG